MFLLLNPYLSGGKRIKTSKTNFKRIIRPLESSQSVSQSGKCGGEPGLICRGNLIIKMNVES